MYVIVVTGDLLLPKSLLGTLPDVEYHVLLSWGSLPPQMVFPCLCAHESFMFQGLDNLRKWKRTEYA